MTNQKMVCNKNICCYYLNKCVVNCITESDGSNDSGTSSFGCENKNNPKSPLSNIPFIETIKVFIFYFIFCQ